VKCVGRPLLFSIIHRIQYASAMGHSNNSKDGYMKKPNGKKLSEREVQVQQVLQAIEKAPFKISEPVQWFDDRFYQIEMNNKQYMLPSVTTKLSAASKGDFLERRRGEIGNREADIRLGEAADRGSRIHHAIYIMMNGGAVVFVAPWNKAQAIAPEQLEAVKERYGENICYLPAQEEVVAVYRFREWMKIMRPLIIGGELKVFSLKHNYAGALDWALHIEAGFYSLGGRNQLQIDESGVYILDIKSGVEMDTHGMQLGAYTQGFEESYKMPVAGGIALYLNGKKPGGVEMINSRLTIRTGLEKEFQDFLHCSALWDRKHEKMIPYVFKFPPIITMEEDQPTKTKTK
jgi:hypothetical protein